MSFWFFLWMVLCGALIYFFGWTNLILYKQKKAWRSYAEKLRLRYASSSLLASPEIKGSVDGYSVALFTDEHPSGDGRTNRKLTAIELDLHSEFPMKGVAASGGMVAHIQNHLSYKHEIKPKQKGWKPTYMVQSENGEAMERYLNTARAKALLSLMEMPNVWVVFLFQDNATLLRLDTPEPLDHPAKIDKVIKQMIKVAKILELEEGEDKDLLLVTENENLEEKLAAKPAAALDLAEDSIPADLELEDDED